MTTAICRLIGGFCWYIVYLKGMWYCVVSDDAHIWFELYYFPFFVEMQAVVAARGVYMFDSSGTSVFKMRGQYICFDNEGTPCIPFCTFHPTGT